LLSPFVSFHHRLQDELEDVNLSLSPDNILIIILSFILFFILSLIIICIFYFSLLLQQGIESNPGPIHEFDDDIEVPSSPLDVIQELDEYDWCATSISLPIADQSLYPLAQPDSDAEETSFNLNSFQFPHDESQSLIYDCLVAMPHFLSNLNNPNRVFNSHAKIVMYYELLIYYAYPTSPYPIFTFSLHNDGIIMHFSNNYWIFFSPVYGFQFTYTNDLAEVVIEDMSDFEFLTAIFDFDDDIDEFYHLDHELLRSIISNDNPDITQLLLMHDIELNPGPYDDVLALYFDYMNLSVLTDHSDFDYFKKRCFISLDILKTKYFVDKNENLQFLFNQMDTLFLPVPQMFSSFNPLNHLSNPLDSLSDSIRNAKVDVSLSEDTLAGLLGVATKISEVNVGINPATKDFLTPKIPDILNLSNVFLWLQSPKNQACTLAILLVILMLARRSYPSSKELLILCASFGAIAVLYFASPIIIQLVTSWISTSPCIQAGDDDWLSICAEILSIGFFAKSCSFSSVDGFASSLSRIEKSSKSFSDFLARIKDLITRMVSRLADSFGYEFNLGFDKHARIIKSFTQRLMLLKQDPSMTGGVTHRFCRDVKALETDIENYLAKLTSVRDNASYNIALNNLMRLMTPLLAVVKNSYIRRAVREVPFNMNLVGASGVGKTQLSTIIITMMFAKFASEDQRQRADGNFFNMCFAPGMGDKFNDGYNDTFAWIFNDFLQRLEVEGMSPSDVLLFIQMLGNSPLPLNCAELSKKGLVMFVSEFIITSMNMFTITNAQCKVLTHLDALCRRINEHCNVLVSIKPKYRKLCTNPGGVTSITPLDDPKFYSGLNKDVAMADDCPNGINTDVYVFDEWDSKIGNYKVGGFRDYNFTQFMDVLCARFTKHRQHQRLINERTARFVSSILDPIPELIQEAALPASFSPLDMSSLFTPKIKTQAITDEVMINDYVPFYPDIDDSLSISDLSHDISSDEMFSDNVTSSLLLDAISDEGLCAWISRYMSSCMKYGYRLTIGADYGFYKCRDNLYNLLLTSADWCDLFYIAESCVNYSDVVIYHSLRLRSRFLSIRDALYNVSLTFLNRFRDTVDEFTESPIKWCRDNPYLAMLGIVAASSSAVLLYKGVFLCIDLIMKIFKVDPEKPESFDESIVDSLHTQADRNEDHDINFMRSPLHNYYRVTLRSSYKNGTYIQNYPSKSLALCGRSILLPYHINHYVETSCLRPGVGRPEIGFIPIHSSLKVPPEWFKYDSLVKDLRYCDQDLMILTLPPHINEFPDIRSYFPRDLCETRKFISSRASFSASLWIHRSGAVSREHVKMDCLENFSYSIDSHLADPESGKLYNAPTIKINLSFPLRMSFPTIVGDCVTPVFIDDPIFKTLTATDSRLQNPFLGYIHLAGASTLRSGYGQFIFSDMFDYLSVRIIKRPVDVRIEEDMAMRSAVFAQITGQSCSTEFFKSIEIQPHDFEPHHYVHGTVPPLPVNVTSRITRSPFYRDIKDIFGITKYPVRLFDTIDNKPMQIARQLYGSNVDHCVDFKRAYLVAEDLVDQIFKNSSTPANIRVYTTKEVLEGVPAEGIRSNDRSTSWGYTMKSLCAAYGISASEMRWAFGRGDKYEYTSFLARIVLQTCDIYDVSLQEGKDMLAIYMDCLKDECKDGTKARLFCACDKIFLLQTKKYFGAFANWIYENRIRNGIAVGINPYSEWDTFYKFLTEVGYFGIAGDYEKFDKKQLALLMFVTKMAYIKYYVGCSPSESRARDALFEEFVSTLHVAMQKGIAYVYEWFHGNTSGNLLTAIINSMTGLFIVKYVCADLILAEHGGISKSTVPQLNVAMRIVNSETRIVTYGDDNIIMISEKLREKLNFHNIAAKILEIFSLIYTDEQKGKRIGYVIPNHTHIFDLTFIARGFRQEGGVIVGPLRDSSVFETLAWYKNHKDEAELLARAERSLKELSPRGPVEFYKLSPPIIKMCVKHLKTPPKFMLWDSAFAAYCAEECLSFDNHFIYGPLNIDDSFLSPDDEMSD